MPVDDELLDQVAVVTGAGKGIGRAIALRLAASGAQVVVTGRDVPALEGTREQVVEAGGRALVVPVDVTSQASVAALAEKVLGELGQVDVLVCNSGVGGPSLPLWDVPLEEWEATLSVNLTGTYLVCRALMPGMVARRAGSVVLIGSMTGKRPLLHRAPYAATKAGLVGFCRTLALDAAPHGVRVNLVSPGFVEGPRLDWVVAAQAAAQDLDATRVREQIAATTPLGRVVDAADVAEAVLFLAGPRSASTTGEDLNVSAGLVMH